MGTVEVEGWRQEARPETEEPRMTFDEISMEKSKSFVNALQVQIQTPLLDPSSLMILLCLLCVGLIVWFLGTKKSKAAALFGGGLLWKVIPSQWAEANVLCSRQIDWDRWFLINRFSVPDESIFSSEYSFFRFRVRVLDNLKGYTVRALVNAVDHLGTVAYKLTDLFQHQSTDISNIGLKISCLDQVCY